MHIFTIIAGILVILSFVLPFYTTTSIYKYHPGIVNARWRIKVVRDWGTNCDYKYYIQVKPYFIWWYVESWGELSCMACSSHVTEASARSEIAKIRRKLNEAYNKPRNKRHIGYIDID